MQGGLLEAAWDCSSANAHIKVFGTIRDEAYANYDSAIKANVRGAILSLRYAPADLRKMIDKLAGVYEGASDFASFVHHSTVRNTRAGIVEDSFDYLSRHTVGRPRDLVHLCSALSSNGDQMSERRFRRIVNETAANSIIETLFVEMAPFLDCLKTPDDRVKLFRLLPYNILTRQEVRKLILEFNGLPASATPETFAGDGLVDPFVELWYCGLLGTVELAAAEDSRIQRFKQPQDSFRIETRCLPDSSYYLLHPSLQTLVNSRGSNKYKVFKFVVIGHEYRWHPYDTILIDLQRELFKIEHSQSELFEVLEEALPYLHAAWSENRDLVDYMTEKQWETWKTKTAEIEASNDESLVKALRTAWANWGQETKAKTRRRKSVASPQHRGAQESVGVNRNRVAQIRSRKVQVDAGPFQKVLSVGRLEVALYLLRIASLPNRRLATAAKTLGMGLAARCLMTLRLF